MGGATFFLCEAVQHRILTVRVQPVRDAVTFERGRSPVEITGRVPDHAGWDPRHSARP